MRKRRKCSSLCSASSALGKHQLCYQTTKEVWCFKVSLRVLLLMAGWNFPFPKSQCWEGRGMCSWF